MTSTFTITNFPPGTLWQVVNTTHFQINRFFTLVDYESCIPFEYVSSPKVVMAMRSKTHKAGLHTFYDVDNEQTLFIYEKDLLSFAFTMIDGE